MYNVKELYGIEPMDFYEEMAYHKAYPYSARTRNNKIRLVKAFEKIRQTAEYMAEYSKYIPVEENESHSARVNNLTEIIERLEKQMAEEIESAIYGK